MEIRVLKYFLKLCETESITAAAQALSITQPALSRQLVSLEEEVGEKLFVRGKKGITLTDAGYYLYKHATEIINLADKTLLEFPRDSQGISGDLRIGAGESPTIAFTVKVIKKLLQEHPGIHVNFVNAGSRDIQTAWLENGFIDFALLGVVPLTKRYSNIKLPLQDTWGLLLRKDDPLAAKPYIAPADIRPLSLLAGRSENFRSLMSGWLGYDFNRLHIIGTSFLMTSTEHLIREKIAYAIVKEGIMNEGITSELCFRPFFPEIKSSVYLVWSSTRELSRLQELFLGEMKTYCAT